MKKNIIYILPILLLSLASVANAQEKTLTKEITVETDFVPVEQKATKLNVQPAVKKTSVPKKTLSYSDWNSMVDFPHTINKFEPYGYKTTYPFSTADGYIDAGIGSQLNIVGSAGYHFIDDKKHSLSAWLQHTSTWSGKNSSQLVEENPLKQKYNDNVVGANYSHRFTTGTLSASAFYHYDHFNYFGANDKLLYTDTKDQTVNEFGITARWAKPVAKPDKPQFVAQLRFNHFGYTENIIEKLNGLKENHIALDLGSEGSFGSFSLGINASADYLHYTNLSIEDKSEWLGMIKASPYIRYNIGNLQFKGGINVDLSAHDGSSVKLSPNINILYKAIDGTTIYADITGGKRLNTLSRFHSLCRYMAPDIALGSSFTPINAEVGVKIGAFSGFYAKPFFAYGVFKDAVLPYSQRKAISNTGTGLTEIDVVTPYVFMQKYEIKGWKAGIELGYNYNGLVDLKAGVSYSPQDKDKGYSTGFDRAEMIANAQVKFTPIKPLSITIGYELRANRCYYNNYGSIGTPPIESWGKTELDNINNLSLDASYRINKTFGVFIHASNLLNQQWDEFVGIGAQKINVLAGVSVQF